MIGTALFSWKHHGQTLGLSHAWLWTGAVCYAHRAGMRCVLVSDDQGADYLAGRLGLPFAEVLEPISAMTPLVRALIVPLRDVG